MNATTENSVTMLALSVHQEMAENFVRDVCGDANSKTIGGYEVAFDILSGDPRLNAGWEDTLKKAGGVILLARFLDVISLDKLKAIYRRLPTEKELPVAVLVVREKGETEFKMSCPVCGQKLWVNDSDSGKRGRCPNCKKAYALPDQGDHVRAQLALPDSVPVLRVIDGDSESAVKAVDEALKPLSSGLIENREIDQSVLKQSTIRVQVGPEE